MCILVLLSIFFQLVTAGLRKQCLRVVGGTITSIAKYPATTAVLQSDNLYYIQVCGGTIIKERHVLSAAHCFVMGKGMKDVNPKQFRIRVGSSTAHINGDTHDINSIIIHPNWNVETFDSDVAIMFTASTIVYSVTVQPAVLADSNYKLLDNEPVWAIGWGYTTEMGYPSEKLRHVRVFTINQNLCKKLYENCYEITDNMMCSGILDGGGRDHCTRDSGSPIYHKGIVVGISSMGLGCGNPIYPGINVRVSRFTFWIQTYFQITTNITLKGSQGNSRIAPKALKLNLGFTLEMIQKLKTALINIACASKIFYLCDSEQ